MTDEIVVTDVVEDPVNLATWLADTAERAAITFAFALVSILVVTGVEDLNVDTVHKLGTAGLVAVATVLSTTLLPKRGFGLSPLLDVVTRVAWSFVQGVTGVIAADTGFQWFNMTAWQTAAVGGVTAAASLIKTLLALRLVNNTVTPASVAPVSGTISAAPRLRRTA